MEKKRAQKTVGHAFSLANSLKPPTFHTSHLSERALFATIHFLNWTLLSHSRYCLEESMFSFFRRYQRAIYFVITAVIILSFSFFGTYSAYTSGRGEDPIVLRTEDGTKITRFEYSEYVHFLSTDCQGSEMGFCNALNDGVIPNDIIATGIGEVLAKRFASEIGPEWKAKLSREKTFQPYRHPQAPFVSAMQVWSYFAPDIKQSFERFSALTSDNPVDLYRCKAALYLAERSFPPTLLRQVLAYQQQQFNWLEPDIGLGTRPLGLFGYGQITDWFGAPFVDKMCEFIIQTAGKARHDGMTVSSNEALASLLQNAEKALQRIPNAEGMTADDLFRRTLRELNIDQSRAVAIWSDVLLFRRSLIELPRNIVVNDQPFYDLIQKESEASDLDCYQLQPSLRCGSMRDVFKIQTWLNGVAPRPEGKSEPLLPPQTFLSPDEVLTSFPEFVERRFILSVGSVTFDDLVKNIRVRSIWNWEVENGNWELLVKEIPSLASEAAPDVAERHRLLDSLSPQLRAQADTIAKEHIVAAHPEWLEKALSAAPAKVQAVNIRLQGQLTAFQGVDNRQALIDELMKAPLGEVEASLKGYTQDNKHFYSIIVLDRSQKSSLVSLPDLLADGTLDHVLDRILEAAYPTVRAERPGDYRKEGGDWKSFQEVKDKVAEAYFASFVKSLDKAIVVWKEKLPAYCEWGDVKTARVAVRFLPQLFALATKLESGGDENSCVTTPFLSAAQETSASVLEERPMKDLWLLVKSHQLVLRRELGEKPQFSECLTKAAGTWLPIRYSQGFGPFVAKVMKKEIKPFEENVRVAVYACQKSLGSEAIQVRATELVDSFFPAQKGEERGATGQ
jgi:GcvH upstream region-like protein